MDLKLAYQNIYNVCRLFKGTAEEHEVLAKCLEAIKELIEKQANG